MASRISGPLPRRHLRDRIHNTRRWRRLSRLIRSREPLCRACRKRGLTVAAECVDHIEPVHLRPDLAFATWNLQPLCRACHEEKTVLDFERHGSELAHRRKVGRDLAAARRPKAATGPKWGADGLRIRPAAVGPDGLRIVNEAG